MASGAPRIGPGTQADVGVLNAGILRVLGLATGGRAPNVFTTLARHRGLFRRWLWFAAALMPGGKLPRADSELVILRVAHNAGSDYEWSQHERLGRAAGLDDAQIARVREGPRAPGWSARQALLLRATDELHATRTLGDELWGELRRELDEPRLIELCLLVGHYEMLAMTLNSLAVEPDPIPEPRSRLARRALAASGRRSRR
jgi:alkylhydroperoxidase family enzyme